MSQFFLIKEGDKIKSLSDERWIDTNLLEPITKLNFEEYGIKNIGEIPQEYWQELGEEFEIITWVDKKNIEDVSLFIYHEKHTPIDLLDEEFEVLTWTDEIGDLEEFEVEGQESDWSYEGKLFEAEIDEDRLKEIVSIEVE